MMKENLNNKHIKEVATYLEQHMEFSADDITKALTKYEMDIDEDIDLVYVKSGLVYVCDDAIIFNWNDGTMEGVDVRRKQYLSHDDCEHIIEPEFAYVGDKIIWFSRNKNFKVVGEV